MTRKYAGRLLVLAVAAAVLALGWAAAWFWGSVVSVFL